MDNNIHILAFFVRSVYNQSLSYIIEPGHEKTCLMPYANNKGTDQTAHPRSLISAFVVRCPDSVVPTLAKSKISRLELVSIGEKAGLNLTWSQTHEDTFSRDVAHICLCMHDD